MSSTDLIQGHAGAAARKAIALRPARRPLATGSRIWAALLRFACLVMVALNIVVGDVAVAAPPAPTPLGPLNGASVTVPATMSWSAVTDPSGAPIIGYNWRVSASPTMTPLVFADSTGATTTQDILSGLVAGSYFWQVQAVSNVGQGEWSPEQGFSITGVGPGTPGTPVLNPTRGYSTFHPWESVHFSWSEIAGAPTYRLEVSTDSNFPPHGNGVVTFFNENIRGTTDGFVHHPSLGEGTFYARVFATDSDFAGGIRSLPSNVIEYTVFYNNPIGPPPVLLSPVNNETLTLPVTLSWAHVPNPQASGYLWEVATDPNFTNIEAFNNQYTEPRAVMQSLTAGPKYWRVLSQHGLSSFNPQTGESTNANTAWSTTGRFTISSAPPVPVSIGLMGVDQPQVVYSGVRRYVSVQLSAALPAGATISLSSSNPGLAPVPATIALGAGFALASFEIPIGQVTSPTPVSITATLNGTTTSGQFSVLPPTLNDDPLQSGAMIVTGGASTTGYVDLEGFGFAGAGGVTVALSTSSTAARAPASVTIPAGARGATFPIQTSPVSTATTVTITARHNAVTTQWPIKLVPGVPPTSFWVRPMSTTSGSQGVVTVQEGLGSDQTLQVTSSDPELAEVPATVTASAGSGVGFFNIVTRPVTEPSLATISVSGGDVTLSSVLTVYPALPALTAITVAPTSVVGGASATGTVRLASAAPVGGVAINLSSSLPNTASVPASVTVPGGATSATFTVTTFPSFLTTVQLSAQLNQAFQSTSITVNPPPPSGPTLSALSVSPGSVTGGNSSTGTVTLTGAAPSGGASVSLSDNSSATAVPASVTVPSGATSANFTVTTTSVTTATSSTISAAFGGVTRTAPLTVNPPASPTPSAPTLISPAGNATPAQPVNFDWSDVANAASYEIQIDDSSTISAPFRANQFVTVSQAQIGGLPAQRLWWRVRARNAAGVFGPFSSTRRFTPQAAPAAASLSAVSVNPASVTGGGTSQGTVTLTSAAPSGGAIVALSSSNTAVATVPASVTVAAGATSAGFTANTSAVGANSNVTLTGTYNGTSRTATLTVTPIPPPASLGSVALNPATVTGGGTSQGIVTLTSAAPTGGAVVSLFSSNTAVATVPASVTVAAGATSASFTASTSVVGVNSNITLTGTYNGASRSATLTVTPVPPPASLGSVTLNPATVTGGASSQGTVTLTSAAPSGGAVVTLSSSNTAVATVPASVTVAAGATSATFTATTTAPATLTAATISAVLGGVTRTATLTINPPAATVTLTVTASGRGGERVTSTPTGINVAVGSTQSAGFASNSTITLRATDERDVIWSGACSSGGNKAKTCSFTLTGNASVSANVQ